MKTETVCSLEVLPRLKIVINWPGSRLLYIFLRCIGKRIVKRNLDRFILESLKEKKRLQTTVRVVLYSKPGCHLCEEMKAAMAQADCAGLYTLEEINIESDPALLARYRNEIPVLCINGIEAFKYRLLVDEFRARLVSSGGKPSFPT